MSYVSQQFLLADNSSTTNFKNWAQAISTAFSSSGWTQTSDTGQVNWATVTVPTAGNFVYEIWQPSDALQTGSTVFYLKIKYGTSSGSGPRIQLQLCSATDGSGNPTGLSTANFELGTTNFSGGGSVVTYDCYFSGDTDRFGVLMWRNYTAPAPMGFVIERTHNVDGTNSGDGVTIAPVAATGTASTLSQATIVFGVSAAIQNSGRSFTALTDFNNASGAFNNNIPVSPVFPTYGKYGNPMTEIAFVHTQDVAEGCVFTSTLYGATRTYIATALIQITNPPNCKFCMRYD